MRPWRNLDGWDQVLERLQGVFCPGGRYEAEWGLSITGLSLRSAAAFVKVSVTESPPKIFVAKAKEDRTLISLGSWQKQNDGSWFSEQWGTVNREQLFRQGGRGLQIGFGVLISCPGQFAGIAVLTTT